jgi:hypothetical protein
MNVASQGGRPGGTCALIFALTVAAATTGCQGIRVPRVDYTFKSPLVTLPLGLPSSTDRRDAFTQVFCKALKLDPLRAQDDCTKYLWIDPFVSDGNALPPLADQYQVIVVAGIFSACLPRDKISIFKQGLAQLKTEGLTTAEEIPVSATGGTQEHAKTIADYIGNHQDPNRPFIAIGYSQGAADLLEAYVNDQVVHDSLKALITIAGAVGGSRLADILPRSLQQLLNGLNLSLPGCDIKGLQGLTALRRDVRYDFLAAHVRQLPRSYSVAAVSTNDTTSAVLHSSWDYLQAYSLEEDSQVIRDEAVVPGGSFLATARADHWAVTLPFKEAHDPLFDQLVTKNDYPRTVLLEAMVRYVMKDLKDHP